MGEAQKPVWWAAEVSHQMQKLDPAVSGGFTPRRERPNAWMKSALTEINRRGKPPFVQLKYTRFLVDIQTVNIQNT